MASEVGWRPWHWWCWIDLEMSFFLCNGWRTALRITNCAFHLPFEMKSDILLEKTETVHNASILKKKKVSLKKDWNNYVHTWDHIICWTPSTQPRHRSSRTPTFLVSLISMLCSGQSLGIFNVSSSWCSSTRYEAVTSFTDCATLTVMFFILKFSCCFRTFYMGQFGANDDRREMLGCVANDTWG